MAKLILTGEIEAIDLKALRGADVVNIDNVADGICQRNGGYAQLVLDLIKGAVVKLCINNESYLFKCKKKDGHESM